MSIQTAERVSSFDPSDQVIFQRHLVAYNKAVDYVKGHLLEIGSGEGYGFDILIDHCDAFTALDKFPPQHQFEHPSKEVFFKQASVPPFPFEDGSFDSLVSFQVIEHIEEDEVFIYEMSRVLKDGGVGVLTTPNRTMSLTRNPWHVREYTPQELKVALSKHFSEVEVLGVYGNEAINKYYEANKKSVQKYKNLDIFNLEQRLPRKLLQMPYDLLNRFNRRKLMEKNTDTVQEIQWTDYRLETADDQCFDLFAVFKK